VVEGKVRVWLTSSGRPRMRFLSQGRFRRLRHAVIKTGIATWLKLQGFLLTFKRWPVPIPVGTPIVLAQVFLGFLKLQVNSGIISQIRPLSLPPTIFPIFHSLIVLQFNAIYIKWGLLDNNNNLQRQIYTNIFVY
jgi:hypothetical protein